MLKLCFSNTLLGIVLYFVSTSIFIFKAASTSTLPYTNPIEYSGRNGIIHRPNPLAAFHPAGL